MLLSVENNKKKGRLMPEQTATQLFYSIMAALTAGLGGLLSSGEELTPRVVLGRALSSCALGVAASSILIFYPDAPVPAVTGFAAVLGSLGTSAIETIVKTMLKK